MNEKIKIITKNTKKIKNYIFAILLALPLFTVFSNSNSLVYPAHTAKMFYFYLVSVIIFIIFALYSIFKKEPIKINITKIDIALLSYYFYSFIRIFFTSNTKIYNDNFIIFTFLIILYFLWKNIFGKNSQDENNIPQNIILFSLLIVGSSWAIFGLLQLYKIVPGNYGGIFTVTGNYGNPSPYANFLAPFLPLGLGVHLLIKPKNLINKILKNVGLTNLILIILILPVTMSRSSWLGAIGGSIFVLDYKYKLIQKILVIFDKLWKRIILIILVLAILITGMSILYKFKKDSADGRILQWKIITKMIADKPIFGHGYESFEKDYNLYQANYFSNNGGSDNERMIADHNPFAHNDYLEIVTNLGLLGLVLFLIFLFFIFKKLYLILKHKKRDDFFILIIYGGFFALLIESFFTFPMQMIPSLINIIFFSSVVSANTENKYKFEVNNYIYKPTAIIIFILIGFFSKNKILNYKAQKDWKSAYINSKNQAYKLAETKYKKIYPVIKNNKVFLLNYGGTLALDKKYKEAIPILLKAKDKMSERNLFLSLGDCYKGTGDLKKAETNYKIVSNMSPHKLYPKYMLFKLYIKFDENEKTIKTAQKLMNMKIKIDNTASREIKADIKKYLEDVDAYTSKVEK